MGAEEISGGENAVNIHQRCRLFTLGVVGWIAVVFQSVEGAPFSAELGGFHAGVAGFIAALAFVPRRMVRWS